jgi:hypothetical protein
LLDLSPWLRAVRLLQAVWPPNIAPPGRPLAVGGAVHGQYARPLSPLPAGAALTCSECEPEGEEQR